MVPYSEVPSRIKEAIVLSQKIESYGVSLRRQGREWVGLCPFHDEKTPSFSVNDEKGLYFCRGCGATGDVISFHADFHSISAGEAIKALASELGITIAPPPRNGRPEQQPAKPAPSTWSEAVLFALNSAAFKVFRTFAQASEVVPKILSDRGIESFTAQAFGLGFMPPDTSLIDEIAKCDNVTDLTRDQLRAGCRELGLIKRHNDECTFSGRLIFPISNSGGDLVGFSGRVLDGDSGSKYINSPDSQVFDKSSILYGLAPVRELVTSIPELRQYWQSLNRQQEVYLVEGYTDVIALAQSGRFAVAAMGTGLSDRQAQLVLRHAKRVVCLYDGDSAGQKAAQRSMLSLFPHLTDAHRLYAATLPPEHDPDSFLKDHASDPDAALHALPRLQPESVWWHHYIGNISRPPGLSDQVLIERAWANHDSYPKSTLWRLMLARRIQMIVGYRVRDPGIPDQLPPWYHSPLAGRSMAIDDPSLILWLGRFERSPERLLRLITPHLRQWWVNDVLRGRLVDDVPTGLPLLFAAAWCLHNQPVSDWPGAMAILLDQGYPAHWLKSWISKPAAQGDLNPSDEALSFEWGVWVESLDESLTNRLLYSVSSASSKAEPAATD